MQYRMETAKVKKSLWGLRADDQTVIYKGQELEEMSLINRLCEDGWTLVSVTAIATDLLGGTSEVVLRYYLARP